MDTRDVERRNWQLERGRNSALRVTKSRNSWLVPIVDKCDFAFCAANGQTVRTYLAQTVPSEGWRSGVLMTRVLFQGMIFFSSVTVYVVNASVSFDDPQTLFLPANPTTTYVARSASFSSSTTAPTLNVEELSAAPIGPTLAVFIEFTQGSLVATSTITLGVTLLGRRF